MSELSEGWVVTDGAPSGSNDGGFKRSFRAQKWFDDHYSEIQSDSKKGLAEAAGVIDAEVAAKIVEEVEPAVLSEEPVVDPIPGDSGAVVSAVVPTAEEVNNPLADVPVVDATPAAQAAAEDLNVDLTEVDGSGVDGKVLVSDVKEAADPAA